MSKLLIDKEKIENYINYIKMKGTLKNKEGKWFVEYKKIVSEDYDNPLSAPIYGIQELPLHPDINPFGFSYNSGDEVEFEIVEEVIDLGRHGSTIGKYAKLIQSKKDNFKSVKEGITQSTKQSGYSVYIPEDAKKQEETTTWDDIFEEYFQNYKEKYDMDIWLKEHYNVPIKKK